MATITVKLYNPIWETGYSVKQMDFPGGAALSQVMDALDIDGQAEVVMLVNSRPVEQDHQLVQGDTVAIFPVAR